jgi:transcription antitermination factor NusG
MDNSKSIGVEDAGVKLPWFALQVHTTRELSVATLLQGRGYTPFLPLYQCRKRWSDRIRVSEAPVFPGYVFCRLNIQNRLPVLMTPGVTKIVGYSRVPVAVDEDEINAIQTMVKSGFPHEPWPFLEVGDRVRIEHGPLGGLEGVLLSIRGAHRLVLSVSLLRRSVALEIDAVSVKWLRSAPLPRHASGNSHPVRVGAKKDVSAWAAAFERPSDRAVHVEPHGGRLARSHS